MTPEQIKLLRDYIAAQKAYDKSSTYMRKEARDRLLVKVEEMVR